MQTTCTRCAAILGPAAVFHVVRLRTTHTRRVWFCCPGCYRLWLLDDEPDAEPAQFILRFGPPPPQAPPERAPEPTKPTTRHKTRRGGSRGGGEAPRMWRATP